MHSESCIGNGTHDELVDEKGNHQDILKFASRADIVVCCLAMNSETVTISPRFMHMLQTSRYTLVFHLIVFRLALWMRFSYLP